MAKLQLPWDHSRTAGMYGLTMQDGTRYTANKRGAIYVERKDHLKAIKAMTNVDLHESGVGFAHVPDDGRYCSRCGFHGWRWQEVCPKDGAAMLTPEDFARVCEELGQA